MVAVGELFAIIVLGVPALYVFAVAVPLIRTPGRWPTAGRGIVWGRLERQPRPSSSQIRSWALVWTAIAIAWIAIVAALNPAAGARRSA